MYCQACAQPNPDEARFCMACGARLMAPAPPDQARVAPPGGAMHPGPAPAGAAQPGPPQLNAALAQLENEATGTMAGLSVSLAAMGLRSPRRTMLLGLGVLLLLVGVGAVGMLALSQLLSPRREPSVLHSQPAAPGPIPVLGLPAPVGLADGGGLVTAGPVIAPSEAPPAPSARRPRRSAGRSPRPGATPAPAAPSAAPAQPGSGGTSFPSGAALAAPDRGAGSAAGGSAPAATAADRSAAVSPAGADPSGAVPAADDDSRADVDDSPPAIELDMYAGRVRRVVRRFYAARARSCFDRATRNNHSLRGTVVVRFTIGGSGQVGQAQSIHNTTGDEGLGRCLAGQVGSWRLPPPPAARPLELEMPFSA